MLRKCAQLSMSIINWWHVNFRKSSSSGTHNLWTLVHITIWLLWPQQTLHCTLHITIGGWNETNFVMFTHECSHMYSIISDYSFHIRAMIICFGNKVLLSRKAQQHNNLLLLVFLWERHCPDLRDNVPLSLFHLLTWDPDTLTRILCCRPYDYTFIFCHVQQGIVCRSSVPHFGCC